MAYSNLNVPESPDGNFSRGSKIGPHGCLLSVFNVRMMAEIPFLGQRSLSLRSDGYHDMIAIQLTHLDEYIRSSFRAAVGSTAGFSRTLRQSSEARVARNLQNFVLAARNFHSATTLTANTQFPYKKSMSRMPTPT
ncbi:hypothetical protein B0T24DRAFT_587278 [Lasiosphaeria ovina]|uniref:Uncharacterized protein n=1 Tax=Lasiosphaeria ovina TaxID=92902 RepID=A0AAE0NJF7_9PEZI|nr:hypothetical protein B0T24DRAFT_587278 [Lasiosphaeria ovina]